jgi:hypothetical protein
VTVSAHASFRPHLTLAAKTIPEGDGIHRVGKIISDPVLLGVVFAQVRNAAISVERQNLIEGLPE